MRKEGRKGGRRRKIVYEQQQKGEDEQLVPFRIPTRRTNKDPWIKDEW
jgi:hypothetical protein